MAASDIMSVVPQRRAEGRPEGWPLFYASQPPGQLGGFGCNTVLSNIYKKSDFIGFGPSRLGDLSRLAYWMERLVCDQIAGCCNPSGWVTDVNVQKCLGTVGCRRFVVVFSLICS